MDSDERTDSPTASQLIERSHYPDHVVAQAIALLELGYSTRKAQRALVDRFGDLAPAVSTVQSWGKAIGDTVHEESGSRERRIIGMVDDLIVQGLEHLDGRPSEVVKNLANLNAIQGTLRDKQARREGLGVHSGSLVTVVFNAPQPELDGTPTVDGH